LVSAGNPDLLILYQKNLYLFDGYEFMGEIENEQYFL